MSTTDKRTGIRKIEQIEGGHIAWLHPGGADLDEVMLAIAREQGEGMVEWEDLDWRTGELREDFPTATLPTYGEREPRVGYYRRMPWCFCGEGHSWHFEESRPGPGAMLAVQVGGAW